MTSEYTRCGILRQVSLRQGSSKHHERSVGEEGGSVELRIDNGDKTVIRERRWRQLGLWVCQILEICSSQHEGEFSFGDTEERDADEFQYNYQLF